MSRCPECDVTHEAADCGKLLPKFLVVDAWPVPTGPSKQRTILKCGIWDRHNDLFAPYGTVGTIPGPSLAYLKARAQQLNEDGVGPHIYWITDFVIKEVYSDLP